MIYMEYHPHAGHAYADGECDEIVREWIEDDRDGRPRSNEDDPFFFSTENILHAMRVAIQHGDIPADQVHVEYKGVHCRIYPGGGISPWPEGFCDYIEKWLLELL